MTIGALSRRGFRDLFVGQTISSLGDWMATVAFMALTLEITDSPAAVGGILTLRLLPAALGGPLAARAIRHWDRRRTMLAMDVSRAGIVALVPLIAELWWVYLCAVLLEVASIVFLPARDASIPDLVEPEDLPVANGLVLGASYGSIPIGAALFAALTAMSFADAFDRPFALVFWVDAASFLVSFLFIARLHQLRAPVGEVTTPDKVRFRDAFRIPLVRAVMPAAAAVAFGLGALFSMGIVFVRVVVDAGDVDFGVLIALFGVGAAGGLLVLRARVGHDPVRETRAGVLAIGVIVAAFSLTASIGLAFVGALLFGGAAAFTLASGMGALQSDLEGHERVLAFAAFHVVIRLALGVAAVAAGLVGEALGDADAGVIGSLEPARVVLLASGLLVLLASLSVRAEQGSTVSA
ncbi:MAG: MFS transporter [Actinobacteria bacterium]|nr:MFS transporter [Actinomycetota bacterium]